jgi:hypothetical protein
MTASGRGKGKGSAFEREVAKKLSLWISNGQRTDLFWRSASSGAMFTSAKGGFSSQAGDIAAIDEMGIPFLSKWVIECKRYKKIGLESFLYGQPSLLSNFWEKHMNLATQLNKQPMLIFKEDRRPTYAMGAASALPQFDILVRGLALIEFEKLLSLPSL